MALKDWTGERSGRLLIVEYLGKGENNKHNLWKAVCDCGNTKTVKSRELNAGDTKSCGCLKTEVMQQLMSEFTDKYKTHGWSGTAEHRAWKRVKGRVCNPNNPDYETYSVLGMEEEWKEDFMSFLSDIGELPSKTDKWSVGRIDNTRGYFKGNIRWELDSQQAKNKGMYKSNKTGETGVHWWISKGGVTYCVATWSRVDGKPRSKRWNVRKYGLMESFANAVKYRRERIAELIANGQPYTEHHGK